MNEWINKYITNKINTQHGSDFVLMLYITQVKFVL